MATDFLTRLSASDPEPMTEGDARVALGALLVRAARSNQTYVPEEVARIERILVRRYRLEPEAAAELRARCEEIERDAPDTVRFTRAIKSAVPLESRIAVIEALWDVVIADGGRDDEQNALLRRIAPLLGVTDKDSHLARQRVEERRS